MERGYRIGHARASAVNLRAQRAGHWALHSPIDHAPNHHALPELPCVACGGTCCTGHRGVLLDDGSILPFVDGRCPNLDDVGGCTIYETRPQGCRDFDCSKEPGYLRDHPRIAALLTVNGIAFEKLPALE